MWSVGFSDSVQSLVMVPIVLYQAEQILCGQLAVILFRRWIRKESITPEEASVQDVRVRDVTDEEDIGLVSITNKPEPDDSFPKLELTLTTDEDSKEGIQDCLDKHETFEKN
jgi:hypothetical protein